MTYGSVGPPWWSEVWIVAGGPSAKDFDLSKANRCAVLCVNDAVLGMYQDVNVAFCSIDPNWIREHALFLSTFLGERFLAVALDTHPECGGIPGATYLPRGHDFGLSDSRYYVNTGGNSGYAAINIAYLKGAKTIRLVGFDMNGPEDKYRQWIPRFKTMLPQLDARGVRVVNHNPASAIDAFDFMDRT